jgi:biopolymer transport protein ExbD
MSVLRDIAEEESKMEMTPMIDVVFLLLIFFMCTLKFKTLEGKLSAYLPKDVGVNTSQAEPIEKVEITLTVLKEGTKFNARGDGPWIDEPGRRFTYGPDRVIRYQIGPRKTTQLSDLEDRLKVLHKQDEERPATIDARPGIVYEEVVRVLDLAMDADFDEVTFVGSYE